jgi:hypothetical protein
MPEVVAHEISRSSLVSSEPTTTLAAGGAAKATTTAPPHDDPVTAVSLAVSTVGNHLPPGKKKRTAEHQITKDDYNDCDVTTAGGAGGHDQHGKDNEHEESGVIQHGFQRASAEVLAKRKIVRVKRPSEATTTFSSNPFATTTIITTGTAKSKRDDTDTDTNNNDKLANPFVATSLISYSNGISNSCKGSLATSSTTGDASEKKTEKSSVIAEKTMNQNGGKMETPQDAPPPCKPKVFGSGSSFLGFQTAVSSNSGFGFGFGNGGSSTGFAAFGKNGTSVSTSGNDSSGFGEVASVNAGFGKTSTASVFGGSTSSTGFPPLSSPPTMSGTSLLQTGNEVSSFTFGNLTKKTDKQEDEVVDINGEDVDIDADADVAKGGGKHSAVSLPEQVQLTTGEEDEEVIHDGRCKSFHWVLKPIEEETSSNTPGTTSETKANPSVKPSTVFQAVISTSKSNKEEIPNKKDDSNVKKDEDAEIMFAKDDKEYSPSIDKKVEKEISEQDFKWQELGVGPMKILSSASTEGKYRLVQRRESTPNGSATKVILNVPLWKESTVNRTASKYLTLKTLVDGKVESYSFRFKDSSDASYFLYFLSECIPNAKSAFLGADG